MCKSLLEHWTFNKHPTFPPRCKPKLVQKPPTHQHFSSQHQPSICKPLLLFTMLPFHQHSWRKLLSHTQQKSSMFFLALFLVLNILNNPLNIWYFIWIRYSAIQHLNQYFNQIISSFMQHLTFDYIPKYKVIWAHIKLHVHILLQNQVKWTRSCLLVSQIQLYNTSMCLSIEVGYYMKNPRHFNLQIKYRTHSCSCKNVAITTVKEIWVK